MKTILAIMASITAATPAYAQYYAPPPPPGYYAPPPGYYQRPRIGRNCEVFLRSPYGGRRYICPIIDPKPVGERCACPAPPPGPGYPPGPYINGRTVR